jgi:hypothetical protein
VSAENGRRRVGLVEACEDARLFNFPLWPRQREILASIEEGPRVHVLALGRRSGKTTMAALVGLWDATLRPELAARVRPGERRHVVAVATSHRQSRLVIQAARSIVEGSPLLGPLMESATEDELHFSTGASLSAFPCTSRGGRGWAISTLIMDEAAHFLSTDGSNIAAEEVWRALVPGTVQFGPEARIVMASTPWGTDGLFAETFQRAESGELEDARATRATTRDVNPTVDEEWLEAERIRDPEGYKAEYEAQFVGSGGAFFDAENIAGAVTFGGDLSPGEARRWVAGLDPAFASDPFGLVIVGRDPGEARRLVVGKVAAWEPRGRKATSLEEQRGVEDAVLAEVAGTIRAYGARAVTDQYKASGVVERLRRYGVSVRTEAMTAPTKDAAFGFLRARLNEGGIDLPENAELLRELRAVRTRYGAGRSSVVLPRIGASHCDRAQALAIAVYEHDRKTLGGEGGSISRPRRRRLFMSSRFFDEGERATRLRPGLR